ncbi:hypothetical protein D9758_012469 [Tetrapyrgos nigripes]|uniref:NADP-dependent oxidoreductase domain-containing protein n=1 Tax=Tetrapyrgos nigripes TaxID=182062 RepID=A0A8H5CYT3_9AGAR|nr:hypothetical protein D9758_012469 [Tetrapyrgos nigripes]
MMNMSGSSSTYHPFAPAPAPPSNLGLYRVLSPHAGIRVSPICLGAMNLGDKWDMMMSFVLKEQSFKVLDEFYNNGGNFIDTACNYQDEESEKILGEWMELRGNRDQMVIATKYMTNSKPGDPSIKQKINYVGNNIKNMNISVENSLKKLRTSYCISIFFMDGLHNLVVAGKVLYLGISDTPAWVVSQCNQYADDHGKTPFVVYQGKWSVLDRSFERDIIPMARLNDMALAPWGVIGGGRIRTDKEEQKREQEGRNRQSVGGEDWKRTEDEKKTCRALEKVAKEVGVTNSRSVAIAYVMQKTPYVFPIIGCSNVEGLKQNLEGLKISLSPKQIQFIENEGPKFDVGFPHSLTCDGSQTSWMVHMAGQTQCVALPTAIRPNRI